ncbi:uncharacterized protein METZ01_LOCUS208540, partial [marine metagenome]
MADDIRKITSSIEKDLHEGGDKLSSSLEKINEKFRGTIERLGKINQPLAQIQADTLKGMQHTYAGALQAKKLSGLQLNLASFMEGNIGDMDVDLLEKLKAVFPDVEFEALRTSSKRMNAAGEVIAKHSDNEAAFVKEKEIMLSRQQSAEKHLLSESDELQALLLEAARARKQSEELSRQLSVSGEELYATKLKEQNEASDAIDQAIEESKKQTLQGISKRHAEEQETLNAKIEGEQNTQKAAQETYDKEKTLHDEQNSKLEQLSQEMAEDTGRLGQFSEGLETLTGFDLVGSLNSMVSNIDAVGKLFGKEDLFMSMVMGMQGWAGNAKEGIQKMMTSTSDFFSNTTQSVKDGLGTAGTFIKEKASDAGN